MLEEKRGVERVNKGNSPESKCELRAKPGLKYDADMIMSARAAGILSIPKILLGFALKQMCPRLIRVVLRKLMLFSLVQKGSLYLRTC